MYIYIYMYTHVYICIYIVLAHSRKPIYMSTVGELTP